MQCFWPMGNGSSSLKKRQQQKPVSGRNGQLDEPVAESLAPITDSLPSTPVHPLQVRVQAKSTHSFKEPIHAFVEELPAASSTDNPAQTDTGRGTRPTVDKAVQVDGKLLALQKLLQRNPGPQMPVKWKKGDSIGSGSFGTVFLGLNGDTGELLAVKEVAMSVEGPRMREAVEQLEREVALLSTLSHPNIVQYIGTSREGSSLFIFLEYVPGGSIASLLMRFGPLEEGVIRIYTRQLLSGLAYLHAQRTVHRDVKGANLLVEKNGRIKLADFGMAKQMVDQVSFTKSFKGSAFWMAPEVIRQQGHGVAADIWSVGCTVLEMATGKPPWSQCTSQVQAIFKIASSQDLPAIPESLSPEASEFILLCLQRDPASRPPAEELLKHPFVNMSSKFVPALGGLDYYLHNLGIDGRQAGTLAGGGGSDNDLLADMELPNAVDGSFALPGSMLHPLELSLRPVGGAQALVKQTSFSPSSTANAAKAEDAMAGADDDNEHLAALVLGGYARRKGTAAGGDQYEGMVDMDVEGDGIDFTTQPQLFRVRGLLNLPPLKMPQSQSLPPVSLTPQPSVQLNGTLGRTRMEGAV